MKLREEERADEQTVEFSPFLKRATSTSFYRQLSGK